MFSSNILIKLKIDKFLSKAPVRVSYSNKVIGPTPVILLKENSTVTAFVRTFSILSEGLFLRIYLKNCFRKREWFYNYRSPFSKKIFKNQKISYESPANGVSILLKIQTGVIQLY